MEWFAAAGCRFFFFIFFYLKVFLFLLGFNVGRSLIANDATAVGYKKPPKSCGASGRRGNRRRRRKARGVVLLFCFVCFFSLVFFGLLRPLLSHCTGSTGSWNRVRVFIIES